MENTEALRNDEQVNYRFRPAKNIERKMFCEAFSRLSVLSNLQNYQYVGFGSTYFVDFILFHKLLGIHRLISIEGDEDMEPRVKFNQPYSCIDVRTGLSTDILPEIDWEGHRSILWLDYIEPLKGYMFKDMATFFNRAVSGSIFVISINVDIKDEIEARTTEEKIKKRLERDVDVKSRIRSRVIENDLALEDYYTILRNVMHEEILEILNLRNKTETGDKFYYKQLFNFVYKDGQTMLSVGGILYHEKDSDKIAKMAFERLEFVRDGKNYFEIHAPHLTNREIHALDKYLPKFNSDVKVKKEALEKLKGVVSQDAIEKYAKVYRYFPVFEEANS